MASEDLEAAVAVWERSRRDAQPWLEERMGYSHDDNLRHFRDVVARETDVWVAHRDDSIVGLLAMTSRQIDQLYVDPSHQNLGVGSSLIEKAKELIPTGFTLFTHQRNANARTFYERRGFRVVAFGISPAPECEPDVEYAWSPKSKSER